ncbi:hypothetical protein DB32_008323 [Sandaracinus amylolyticus]|uniref:Uncharacterized protein n=1 Tax=Sandaracinus amylolyticus TaxID=927083 RepID=A0A0F6SHW9_9BACT|nr:hypothetical protein DB32_008323 [Sandaracinus amylolyticus]
MAALGRHQHDQAASALIPDGRPRPRSRARPPHVIVGVDVVVVVIGRWSRPR